LLDRIKQQILERRESLGKGAAEESMEDPDGTTVSDSRLKVLRDVAYGSDPKQKMDIYLPEAASAPLPP